MWKFTDDKREPSFEASEGRRSQTFDFSSMIKKKYEQEKKIPVLEKLNHTSVTPAPFMVLDHSALSKKLSAHKRHLSFLSPGFRDDRRSIEVTGEAALGWFQPFLKSFSKETQHRLREKKEIENILCSKITVTSPCQREKPNRKSKEA